MRGAGWRLTAGLELQKGSLLLMPTDANSARARLLPVMRYRDVAGAIDWLGAAFGFARHHVVKDERGGIRYAVLRFNGSLVMLAPVRDSDPAELMRQPDEIGGAETQSCYFVVEDAEAHCTRAKAGGATIIFDLKEYDYGGRGYSCRDPEGHIWNFGTYDPWQAAAVRRGSLRRNPLAAAGVAVLLVAIGVAGWLAAAGGLRPLFESGSGMAEALSVREAALAAAELEKERSARLSAERAAYAASEELGRARAETKAAEQSARQWARRLAQLRLRGQRMAAARGHAADEATKEPSPQREAGQGATKEARDGSARERGAKQAAERSLQQTRDQLLQERRVREAAQRSAQGALKGLAAERSAKEAAERSAVETRRELALERSAKQAAQQAAQTLREQLSLERGAREAAERAAEAARSRLAELQEAKAGAAKAAEDSSPQRSKRKPAPKPQPAKDAARQPAQPDPMPSLVP